MRPHDLVPELSRRRWPCLLAVALATAGFTAPAAEAANGKTAVKPAPHHWRYAPNPHHWIKADAT